MKGSSGQARHLSKLPPPHSSPHAHVLTHASCASAAWTRAVHMLQQTGQCAATPEAGLLLLVAALPGVASRRARLLLVALLALRLLALGLGVRVLARLGVLLRLRLSLLLSLSLPLALSRDLCKCMYMITS